MLTTNDIAELQQIYFEEFGERISTDEAWEMGRRLLRFAELMLPPLASSDRKETDQGSNPISFDNSERNF